MDAAKDMASVIHRSAQRADDHLIAEFDFELMVAPRSEFKQVPSRSANFSTRSDGALPDPLVQVLASARGCFAFALFNIGAGEVDERFAGFTRTRGKFESTRATHHRT
jgi:hypothetical protein